MRTVIFDLETGGVQPHHPDIQLAALAVDDTWEEIDHIEIKIQFDPSTAEAEALQINHFDPEVWRMQAMPESRAVSVFSEWLRCHAAVYKTSKSGRPYKVARLAGYNSESFDFPRLQRLYQRHQSFLPAEYGTLDVLQLARWFYQIGGSGERPINLKLGTVVEDLGIQLDGFHDALADVRATAAVAREIMRRLKRT